MFKKFAGLAAALTCIILFFSGCVNATYEFKIHHSGSVDAKYKILIDSKTADSDTIQTLISEFKKHFNEDKYKVSDYEEDGFVGIKVTKRDFTPEELANEGNDEGKNLDYSSSLLKGLTITEGIFANSFQLDSSIDLSYLTEEYIIQKRMELFPNADEDTVSLSSLRSSASNVFENNNVTVIDKTDASQEDENGIIYEKGNVTVYDQKPQNTQEPDEVQQAEAQRNGANKLLANANLKIVIKFPNKVVSSNANQTDDNGKTLEWILIPGTVNKISASGSFTNTLGFVTVWVCIGLVVLVLAIFSIRALKRKKSKESQLNS